MRDSMRDTRLGSCLEEFLSSLQHKASCGLDRPVTQNIQYKTKC